MIQILQFLRQSRARSLLPDRRVDHERLRRRWGCGSMIRRPPDLEIGGSSDPYLRRWFLIPRNRFFNIYLHQFLRDDDDRALHDHPWPNLSILLQGSYREVRFVARPEQGKPLPQTVISSSRSAGCVIGRRAKTAHRVVLPRDSAGHPIPCWSLFLTGPNLRSWGFWCPLGRWVHWRDFTAGPRGEIVGRGCDT